MHDTTDGSHWHEPEGMKNAGYGAWKRPNTPYDDYMEAQGIPIYRGIGVRRVQDMPLKRWNRMGGNGTFIQLYGTEGRWGCYVIEVPGAGALNAERHMYEEIMVVVEGRGTTEIWTDDQKKPHSFEWQRGSMFSIPLNTWHRIINAASSPALILVASTAPNVPRYRLDLQLSRHFPVPLRRQRELLQAQGRHRARSAARACHAQDQPHPRPVQCRALSR
jgi:mannose-6-phosphate isomerase-like protein (cupin superfamily)